MKKTTVTGLEEKWEVFLVYILGFLGFIFSFLKYDYLSENIKFHYKQSGTIWLVYVIFSFIAKVFGSILGGAVFVYIASCIVAVLLVFIIITIVKAFEGTRYEIPVIADLSKKIFGEE